MEDIVLEKQDLCSLRWSKVRRSSGTAGSFYKAYECKNGHEYYYKLSDFDAVDGAFGVESLNELVADRLLTHLGIEHLPYRLIHGDILIDGKPYETYVCVSENFRKDAEQKIALDLFYEMNRLSGESPMEFCTRMGWKAYISRMLLIDFLILNRDRHGANIEVLRTPSGELRLAPLFDHGVSLLCRSQTERDILSFDVMEDRRIQSFAASSSAFRNLELIHSVEGLCKRALQESDKELILSGLWDLYPPRMADKIWEMIWKRWCYYADICNR